MRTLPLTVVVSTAVHLVIVAVWLAREEKPPVRRVVAESPPVAKPELVVELVDLTPRGGGSRPSAGDRRGPRISSSQRTRGATPPEVAPAPDRAPVAPTPGATLAMRARSELPTLPQGAIDELVAKPLAPVPELPKLARKDVELVRQRDGSYRTEKDRFIARVDPDGKVHLKDTPNLEIKFGILAIAGRFDVTDWAMRSRGMDPYASQKLEFLDRTRDQRVAIGQEYRRAQLAQSDVAMRQNIDRLWATTTDLAARKQGLFELWDDCAETGDAALIAGGMAARSIVTNFIQTKMRGTDAFTVVEIAQLNAVRRSKATFAPYE